VNAVPLLVVPALVFVASISTSIGPGLADNRTQKYRSGGCEIERQVDSDGKFETKVDCKPGYGRGYFGAGKEEFVQGGCEIKREWKRDGEHKEEVKCK
jgi:hypothetical protein